MAGSKCPRLPCRLRKVQLGPGLEAVLQPKLATRGAQRSQKWLARVLWARSSLVSGQLWISEHST